MASDLILGIDVGTTSVKAGVINGSGHVIESFSQSYVTQRKDQIFVEQNPDDWFRLICAAIDEFNAEGNPTQSEPRVFFTLIGVLILGILDNGLTQIKVDSYIREILVGFIVIAAVAIASFSKNRN